MTAPYRNPDDTVPAVVIPACDPGEHNREFFLFMQQCRDAYRRLADCIHETMGRQRALDLGAGLGLVGARLQELGWHCCSADPHSPPDLREGHDWWNGLDLRLPGSCYPKFQCVICTETAEHIEEQYADAIVDNCDGRAGEWCVWSAAQPGQEWPGHVNLQPADYWIAKFVARGWKVHEAKTTQLRGLMLHHGAQHVGARDNFQVFGR